MATLMQKQYKEQVAPALQKQFGYDNVMQIPGLEKVVLNVGVGTKSNYNVETVVENLKKITGQNPIKTLAKKSISNFKVREGEVVGLKITLRGKRMYEFVERLVHVTLPRVHDFRGLALNGFDRNGNYTLGLRDQLAFPEIKAESLDQLHGVQVTISTTAQSAQEGEALLRSLGFPLQETKEKK